MNIHPVNPGGGVVLWMCGWYARQSRYGTFICVNKPLSSVPPKFSYAEYKPFVVALWFRVPEDMTGGTKHIIVPPNTFAIRLNNMMIEYSVWGMNFMGPNTERGKLYHAILEYSYGHLAGYLNLTKVVENRGSETHTWGLVDPDGYLGIGYRIDQPWSYFWEDIGYIFIVEGSVGRATKQAFFNALFYGIALPRPRESKGVTIVPAGQARITVYHGLQIKPSKVLVQPYANTYAWVENITASSFDIIIATPQNKSTQIAWYAEI